MTIRFTKEELDNIVKEPFNWHISEECPKELRKTIAEKLEQLRQE